MITVPRKDSLKVQPVSGVRRPDFSILHVNQGRQWSPLWFGFVAKFTTALFSDESIDEQIYTSFSIFLLDHQSREVELYTDKALVISVAGSLNGHNNYRCVYVR